MNLVWQPWWCRRGVNYESFDGSPANLLFMIAAPDGEADAHLEALSKLSMVLMDPGL